MRSLQLLFLAVISQPCLLVASTYGETDGSVALATHNETRELSPIKQTEAAARIRNIVLNQGDDARALANLVQLCRELPDLATSQLYLDLAADYLKLAKYNQAANVLQQHLTQYPDGVQSAQALTTLIRLYSSSEVSHTQQADSNTADDKQAFLKYANFLADQTAQKNPKLADDPTLTFQRAVSTRLAGRDKAAQGRLTKLKHQTNAGVWHTRARAEHWLLGDRSDESPLPQIICRRANQRPVLDGNLGEACWQQDASVRFAFDNEFLYLAVAVAKDANQSYEADARSRAYDADLSEQDHVRIQLDLDRDYATSFELAIDHRGWTNDRCWLDPSWNPKWFVAHGSDATHWFAEAAIAIDELTARPLQGAGDAWAVSWERVLPNSDPQTQPAEANRPGGGFQLLLFE